MDEFDYKYKIILIGDSMVGKTSFFNRINQHIPLVSTVATIGVDVCKHTRVVDNKNIRICLWDTAGQEQYKSIIKCYFREICGSILMFDVTNYSTFTHIERWIKMLKFENRCKHEHPILLLGNKTDKGYSNVPSHEIEKLCSEENISYYETSCNTDTIASLEKIFASLIEKIYLNKYDACIGIQDYNKNNINITTKIIKEDKRVCCI